jgi:hypothetical protein
MQNHLFQITCNASPKVEIQGSHVTFDGARSWRANSTSDPGSNNRSKLDELPPWEEYAVSL